MGYLCVIHTLLTFDHADAALICLLVFRTTCLQTPRRSGLESEPLVHASRK
jgi:hypothetical protein